jgi:hypothetical protein
MLHKSWIMMAIGVFLLSTASLAFCADIVGTVLSDRGDPVQAVRIIAQTLAGKIVKQAVPDGSGKYQITGLDPGTYTYALDPLQTGFKGGTVVSYLGSKGMTINWKVSGSTPAIAFASEGTEVAQAGDPFGFSDREFASIVVLGASVAGGAAVLGYGAAGGFSGAPSSASK